MRSCLIHSDKPSPWALMGFIAVLVLALSGWTCTAIVGFQSCLGVPSVPQITSLSPNAVFVIADPVLLTVSGSAFVSQTQILWNGSALPTTFVDSQHLQTTITQQTFDLFGGSPGGTALISVNSPVSAAIVGCPTGGSSATLVLVIN
jgi:IPT/TIG domain-containing protein